MQPYEDMEAVNVSMLECLYGSSYSSLHRQIVKQYDIPCYSINCGKC
jgi:hypothetical protein